MFKPVIFVPTKASYFISLTVSGIFSVPVIGQPANADSPIVSTPVIIVNSFNLFSYS